jgi:lysyl-tRNA synthetase class 2
LSEKNLSEILRVRHDKLADLRERDLDPFEETKYNVTQYARDVENNFETYEGTVVSMAGRIMSKRGQGKVGFYDLQDSTGKIQMFIKKDIVGEEKYADVKTYDIGDIVGIEGEVFKTKMGQVSVRVSSITLLSKSLQVLPEKYHGLKDHELRYRQRYIDLIVNPEVRDVFFARSKIINAVTTFYNNRGFMAVETPVLDTLAGGANARPFITNHNTLDLEMYMRIALELPLKRLIVGGFDKVFEIGRVFRNEGMDSTHNPEFTMLESYEAYADYEDVMNLLEDLFEYLCKNIAGSDTIVYQGKEIDMSRPFKRKRMVDLVTEYTGVNFDLITDYEEALAIAKEIGLDTENVGSIGELIEDAFDEFVEDKIINPTFVTHHPVEISPLAKKDKNDKRYTERFELFINGAEYANGFSELNDPIDQRERFIAQVEKKAQGDDESHPFDQDFINALEIGLPPTGGLGIGIDRTVMLFTDQSTIRDVLLFPTMKPTD